MDDKDQSDSKIAVFITQIKDSLETKLRDAASWLDTIDGRILFNGISTISPFIVGNPVGFLAPFILESLDAVIRERFLKNLSDIGDLLVEEKSNLNNEFIQSVEGQKLLKNTFRRIIQETNEEKIEYLKKFLFNSYSDKKPNSELIDTFFKILTNMEPIHIKLLTILKNPKEIIIQVANERKKKPRPVEERHYGKSDCAVYWSEDSDDDLNNFYLHTEPVIYSNAHKDLVTWNILETKLHKFWLYSDETTFDSNLDHHLSEIDRWTTSFGKQFLNYIYKNDSKGTQKSL